MGCQGWHWKEVSLFYQLWIWIIQTSNKPMIFFFGFFAVHLLPELLILNAASWFLTTFIYWKKLITFGLNMSQRCSGKLYHVTSLHNVKMNTSRGCKGMFIVQSHQEFGFYLKSLCDWITKRAPLPEPIRFKTGYTGSMQHWIY